MSSIFVFVLFLFFFFFLFFFCGVFFFFQAEDGIRDVAVTGVQTCALPICAYHAEGGFLFDAWSEDQYGGTGHQFDWSRLPTSTDYPLILAGGLNPDNVAEAVRLVRPDMVRSEERRVGKECRSRWSRYD